MSRRHVLATAVATALLTSLVGAYATPAQAAPVLAADTLRSGAGFAFGANDKGQTNPGSSGLTSLGAKQLPDGSGGLLADAVSIAAGKQFTSWVDRSGAVWGLGDNAYGQSGSGSTGGVLRTPARAIGFGGAGQPKAVKVSAFGQATVVLDSDGAVWQWGNVVNSQGNNQVSSTPNKVTFPTGTTRIIDISAGELFSLALDDAYRAYAWGKNDRGQLGLGTTNTSPSPARITSLPAVAAGGQALLEAGRDFSAYAASTATGTTLYTWGRGDAYQLGAGTTTDSRSPKLVATLAAPLKAVGLSAGTTHSLLVTNDGKIRTWGSNGLSAAKTPTLVADPSGVISGTHRPYTVAAGDGSSLAANTDGTLAAWGVDTTGQLGRTTTGTVSVPTLISVPGTTPASLYGVPAAISSRYGATYVVVDAQAARTSAGSYDFGAFPTTPAAGQTAPTQTVTFTNAATKPLAITSLLVEGANAGDFTLSGSTCTGSLAVAATCSAVVTFQPQGTGARTAGIVLRTSNTAGGLALAGGATLTGRGYAGVAGLANLALDVANGSPTTVSGPGNVIDLRTLSPSLIPVSLPPTPSAQLGKIPLADAQLGKILPPLPQLGKIQLGKIPVTQLQLGKIPVSTQLGKILPPLPQLGKIQLGKIPLTREGGWTALLQAYPNLRNIPVSSLTLADLLNPSLNTPDSTTTALPLERVALGDIDLRSSEFGRLSWLSILMGKTRLGQYGGVDWCADLPKVTNGGQCTDGAGLNRTLLDLDLLQRTAIDETRAGAVTVGQLRTDALSSSTSALDEAVFPELLISGPGVSLSGTRPGLIPLSTIPALTDVLTCANGYCTDLAGKTLGDAELAGQVKPTATYRSLGSALNGIALASLIEPYLDRGAFDWESLPVADLPLQVYPNRITLQADVDVNCASATGTTLGVKLPAGFRYVPGTATLTKTRGTGTVSLADPVVDTARGLVVSVPDSSYSSTGPIQCADDAAHLTVKLGVLSNKTPGSAYRATADVRTSKVAPLTATQGKAITVTGIEEPPSTTPDGPLGAADQLILGSVAAGQVKYVPFHTGAAGRTVEVTVSNQTADIDAVLYYPKGAPADAALSGATSTTEVPFGEAVAGEATVLQPLQSALGGALQDIKLRTDRPIAAIAATRGTDLEQASAISRTGIDDVHLLSVAGFNGTGGSFSARIRVIDALTLANCVGASVTPTAAPTAAFYGGGSALPVDANTLVLVNRSRLEGIEGTAAAKTALDALQALTHPTASQTTGVKGEVLQVDSNSSVRSAYAAWDASPCSPLAADAVVKAINTFVAPYLTSGIRNVVLVGGDRLIPHARLEDHTRDGNEREEAADVAFKGGNPIASAFAAGYYLTDDPYGTKNAQTVFGQVVYLPQALPQRLGESAADIAAAANAFIASNGVADPQTASGKPRTAVVTDYDFLTRGGDATAASLTSAGYGTDHTLTGESATWTRAQLHSKWLGSSNIPSVAALNMHYDQYRGLPAAGNATNDLTDLYRSADVATADLTRRLVFTVGCHSALDIPDALTDAGDARALDFAQAYAKAKTAAMLGNLGFGYADTTAVAYSVKQQQEFSAGLAQGYDIGTAALEAKRRYLTRLAGLSAYDLKSMQQTILWGLGSYRLKAGPAVQPPTPPTVPGSADPLSGVVTRPVTVGTSTSPVQFTQVTTAGSVHDAAGPALETVSVPGRPVLPAQFVDLDKVDGLTVHGVVPTDYYAEQATPVVASFARPGTDKGLEQERQSLGTFPATRVHVGSTLGVSGVVQSTLVYTPEEIELNGTTPGSGLRQRFPRTSLLALYGPADAPYAPLHVTNVFGTALGGATAVTADVTPSGGRTVRRVFALARPSAGWGQSIRIELAQDPQHPGHWSGGYAGSIGSFDVYAIDDHGNTGVSTLKGAHFEPRAVPGAIDPTLGVQIALPAPGGANGWYLVDPELDLVGPNAQYYAFRVNGGELQPSGSVVVGDGGQLVEVIDTRTGESVGGGVVKIDKVNPVITIASDIAPTNRIELNEPRSFTTYVTYGASGGATVVDNGVALGSGRGYDARVPGLRTLEVTATSAAGRAATATQDYRVVYDERSSGFNDPVAPAPGLNLTVQQLVYGFGFHLVDHNGADVNTGAGPGSTKVLTDIACPSTSYKVQLPRITGETAEPLSTGGGNWMWDIKMPSTGVLVCKHLTVTANDGWTTFEADIQIAP